MVPGSERTTHSLQGNLPALERLRVTGASNREIVGFCAIAEAESTDITATAAHSESGEFLQIPCPAQLTKSPMAASVTAT
jgi:hypothetical protein